MSYLDNSLFRRLYSALKSIKITEQQFKIITLKRLPQINIRERKSPSDLCNIIKFSIIKIIDTCYRT